MRELIALVSREDDGCDLQTSSITMPQQKALLLCPSYSHSNISSPFASSCHQPESMFPVKNWRKCNVYVLDNLNGMILENIEWQYSLYTICYLLRSKALTKFAVLYNRVSEVFVTTKSFIWTNSLYLSDLELLPGGLSIMATTDFTLYANWTLHYHRSVTLNLITQYRSGYVKSAVCRNARFSIFFAARCSCTAFNLFAVIP